MNRLRNLIGNISTDKRSSSYNDNLAIVLCEYYSIHPDRPLNDQTNNGDWGEWVLEQTDSMLDRITNTATEYFTAISE